MPKPKGKGPNGGRLQSHHGLQGKWSSSLQEKLKNIVSDFEKAGFSKEIIRGTLEQQYRMLDKLKVKYERIEY